jgi:hypothetical protein
VVKAGIWYVVEQMHARGISKLYAGPVSSPYEVRCMQLLVGPFVSPVSMLAGLLAWIGNA